jgi:hypothetical protein
LNQERGEVLETVKRRERNLKSPNGMMT